VLFSTRGYEDLIATRDQFAALPFCPIGPAEYQRAFAVMEALAERHRHRQATFTDCLIAAAAESAGIGLLHYDADFDAICAVTGQPSRAVAPIGSLR
jgi:predicted nucleic acid-binding protein